MTNIVELKSEAAELIETFKAGNATDEQKSRLKEVNTELKAAQENQLAEDTEDTLRGLSTSAKSANSKKEIKMNLGQHFVESFKTAEVDMERKGASFRAPEFKLATDPVLNGAGSVTEGGIETPVASSLVTNLFGQANIGTTSYRYTQILATEGAAGAVAEGGAKPQLSVGTELVTENLGKVAGFLRESDELLEDQPALASVINGVLVEEVKIAEENQILNGTGTGGSVRGLLGRTGIQTGFTAANNTQNFETLLNAILAVKNVSNRDADAILINPSDYAFLLKTKDGNGQYLLGGPAYGAYGAGTAGPTTSIWGVPVYSTSAVAVGTAVVGAFKQGATVFRRSGVSVAISREDGSNFTSNLVTVLAEERLLLAVRVPSSFARVTLSQANPI